MMLLMMQEIQQNFCVFEDEELFDQTLRKIEEVMKPSSLENTLGNLIKEYVYVYDYIKV